MLQSSRARTTGAPTLQSLPPIQPLTGPAQVPPMPLQILGALPLQLPQMIGVPAMLLPPLQLITPNQRVVLAGTENQKKRITP